MSCSFSILNRKGGRQHTPGVIADAQKWRVQCPVNFLDWFHLYLLGGASSTLTPCCCLLLLACLRLPRPSPRPFPALQGYVPRSVSIPNPLPLILHLHMCPRDVCRTAVGVDLDGDALAWSRARHAGEAAGRVALLRGNVSGLFPGLFACPFSCPLGCLALYMATCSCSGRLCVCVTELSVRCRVV